MVDGLFGQRFRVRVSDTLTSSEQSQDHSLRLADFVALTGTNCGIADVNPIHSFNGGDCERIFQRLFSSSGDFFGFATKEDIKPSQFKTARAGPDTRLAIYLAVSLLHCTIEPKTVGGIAESVSLVDWWEVCSSSLEAPT